MTCAQVAPCRLDICKQQLFFCTLTSCSMCNTQYNPQGVAVLLCGAWLDKQQGAVRGNDSSLLRLFLSERTSPCTEMQNHSCCKLLERQCLLMLWWRASQGSLLTDLKTYYQHNCNQTRGWVAVSGLPIAAFLSLLSLAPLREPFNFTTLQLNIKAF